MVGGNFIYPYFLHFIPPPTSFILATPLFVLLTILTKIDLFPKGHISSSLASFIAACELDVDT